MCTYSGSSSDTETELEHEPSWRRRRRSGLATTDPRPQNQEEQLRLETFKPNFLSSASGCFFFHILISPPPPPPPCAVEPSEETLTRRRSGVEKPLSIMDLYPHDVFSHLELDGRRRSQYNLLHKEASLDGKPGDRLSVSITSVCVLVITQYSLQ